jgi:hypothetical protein
VRTGKRLLLIFLIDRPAAQMPGRYVTVPFSHFVHHVLRRNRNDCPRVVADIQLLRYYI